MATLNRKVVTHEYNNEGVKARKIGLVQQLERSVMSCLLWEDSFYEDGVSIAERITELCKKVRAEEVVRIAIHAKEEMRLRHVPLLLACELAKTKEGRSLLNMVLPKVIVRVDDITEFMAIYWKDGKKPIAKQIKKYLGEAFRKFDEYQLQKYNGGSKAVKLKDVMKLTRPKPSNKEQAELWRKLIKDELATPDTWEVAISATKDKKAEWTRLLQENKLGGLAMLRNIRNMTKAGVEDELISEGIQKINAGKLVPINFINAGIHNPQFENKIEEKFFESFSSREKVKGKTILLVDISPSMDAALSARSQLTRMDIGFSLAMLVREMFDDVRIMSFSNDRVEVPARRGFGLRDAIKNSQPSNGTMLGKSLQNLPAYDRLIVITDEQSQDPVPDMKGYLINVASDKNGVGYGQWTHIDGWSDRVLNYLLKHEQAEINE